jgi:hypothetical protein
MPLHPIFVHGAMTTGEALAWAVEPDGGFAPDFTPHRLRPVLHRGRVQARVRGRLWRLPSGDTLLELDGRAGWVDGEIVPRPDDARLCLIEALLGCRQRRIALTVCPARTGNRAVSVAAWAAEANELVRLGARPLPYRKERSPDRLPRRELC